MPTDPGQPFLREADDGPAVRGFLHRPSGTLTAGLVLTHGAGGNARAPLLVSLGDAFAAAGVAVLRCDLPFRQRRPVGPPSPSTAALDRAGLRQAVRALRALAGARTFLGGVSYGGRQASLLAAEEPDLATGLLLLAYPLHPPGRVAAWRTGHFPAMRTPVLFVRGTRDPFGTVAELQSAVRAIPAPSVLIEVSGAGHDLGGSRPAHRTDVAALVMEAFLEFFAMG